MGEGIPNRKKILKVFKEKNTEKRRRNCGRLLQGHLRGNSQFLWRINFQRQYRNNFERNCRTNCWRNKKNTSTNSRINSEKCFRIYHIEWISKKISDKNFKILRILLKLISKELSKRRAVWGISKSHFQKFVCCTLSYKSY